MHYQPAPKLPEAIQPKWAAGLYPAASTAWQATFQAFPPACDRSWERLEGLEARVTALEGE